MTTPPQPHPVQPAALPAAPAAQPEMVWDESMKAFTCAGNPGMVALGLEAAAPAVTVAQLAQAADRKAAPIMRALNVFGSDVTLNQPLDLALIGAALCNAGCRLAATPTAASAGDAPTPKLQVWFGPMPESNGKTNWTAILHSGDIYHGITLERSEYRDRVRYEADRARHLIGEMAEEPDILAYDPDLCDAPAAGLLSEIEDAVAAGRMNAAQVFTQMRALLTAQVQGEEAPQPVADEEFIFNAMDGACDFMGVDKRTRHEGFLLYFAELLLATPPHPVAQPRMDGVTPTDGGEQ